MDAGPALGSRRQNLAWRLWRLAFEAATCLSAPIDSDAASIWRSGLVVAVEKAEDSPLYGP